MYLSCRSKNEGSLRSLAEVSYVALNAVARDTKLFDVGMSALYY
jgi:hypothetical protein